MIRVLIAEDMHMVRGALVALLHMESDIDVVAEVERGDTIVETAVDLKPDVALIDIDLPGVDGLTAAALLKERLPECRTLILTSLHRPGVLRRALSVQVAGYLLKDAPPAELAAAIRTVAANGRVIDRQLALDVWQYGENPLTAREAEVLRLAATGAGPKEIATQFHLSVGTIRNYLTSAVAKINARNRHDAIRIASESGWI
ncbi:DNA-binding response regulator [Streptomyces sp. NPDC012693]|uniref:response regulator transcription factor n=1 Tax=unclassified Streptomyces TaxID=2593676 RepID=UPI002546E807|nr:response regulator transcription factor [Streptomyces sp. MSC1_001]